MIKIRFINILLPRTYTHTHRERETERHTYCLHSHAFHTAQKKKEMNEKMATGPANGNGNSVLHGTGV